MSSRNADVVSAAGGEVDVSFGVVGLLDAGVHFRAVEQAAAAIELRDVYEFPRDELALLGVESVLLFFAEGKGFAEGFVFIRRRDEAELFIELRGMVAVAADDPENELGEIPVHINSFSFFGGFVMG